VDFWSWGEGLRATWSSTAGDGSTIKATFWGSQALPAVQSPTGFAAVYGSQVNFRTQTASSFWGDGRVGAEQVRIASDLSRGDVNASLPSNYYTWTRAGGWDENQIDAVVHIQLSNPNEGGTGADYWTVQDVNPAAGVVTIWNVKGGRAAQVSGIGGITLFGREEGAIAREGLSFVPEGTEVTEGALISAEEGRAMFQVHTPDWGAAADPSAPR
jgi:hypothetical protein